MSSEGVRDSDPLIEGVKDSDPLIDRPLDRIVATQAQSPTQSSAYLCGPSRPARSSNTVVSGAMAPTNASLACVTYTIERRAKHSRIPFSIVERPFRFPPHSSTWLRSPHRRQNQSEAIGRTRIRRRYACGEMTNGSSNALEYPWPYLLLQQQFELKGKLRRPLVRPRN